MQLRIKNTRIHIDFLTLLFPFIAALLGEGRTMVLLMLSLSAHETAHLMAARVAKASVRSMRLTPFGAIAQLDNPYLISAARLILISAAGPLANLLMILTSAALCHWHLLAPLLSVELLQINAVMMLFNLMPALPLDGGRILYALTSLRFSRRQASELGIFLGRLLAISLFLLSVWGFLSKGILNLSPLFAAVLILTSARDERRAFSDSRVHSLIDSILPLKSPTRAEIIAIDSEASPHEALNAAAPGHITLFAVFQNGQFAHLIDDRSLVRRLLEENISAPDKKIQKT